MQKITNKLILLATLYSFPLIIIADTISRPNSNNKSGITKKTEEQKENSFINRVIKGKLDIPSFQKNKDLDQIKSDIIELKKEASSNEKILTQIKMLSDLKNEGILTESEFNNKKKVLLNKIK
ncbi:MAG: hypothetical protein ACI93D_000763 [Gammaproteobacteria bacterium]|jgi:hypothetical protein|tara:strand:- start:100 stop:468 length:369 start_codon:yes stop_codon:yes gene_type:complete